MKLRNIRMTLGRNSFGSGLLGAMILLGVVACKTEAEAEKAPKSEPVAEVKAATGDIKSMITAKLQAVRPNLPVNDVVETGVPGVLRVEITGSGSIYAIQNGDYFFAGDMFKVEPTGFVNVTEQEKAKVRGPLMAAVKPEDTIAFKPPGDVKAVISVFTDVDCGYCQKLHREVPELNAMGIEVRYLAFPRAGIPSPSYDKIASAWCAENPQEALTKVKNREKIDINVCDGNPVADQYMLGQKIGVNGTPAIVLDNGDLIPGYMPAANLASRLGIN